MQYFIEVKRLFCLITLYLQWQPPTCICFCCCVVCVVVGSVLSRVPRAWLLTSEVIIYSIYKTMYVQNRKIWKTKDTEAKVKRKPDGTASLPLSKKTIMNKCAVYIIWNSKSMMHMNIWFLHYWMSLLPATQLIMVSWMRDLELGWASLSCSGPFQMLLLIFGPFLPSKGPTCFPCICCHLDRS